MSITIPIQNVLEQRASLALAAVGIHSVDWDSKNYLPGRHRSFWVQSENRSLHVKSFGEAGAARLSASLEFAARTHSVGIGPAIIATDGEQILVTEFVRAAEVSTLVNANGADTKTFRKLGSTLGALHEMGIGKTRGPRPALPSSLVAHALSLEAYDDASGGELEAWRLIQSISGAVEALASLEDDWESAAYCFVHGDLRLDQALVTQSGKVLLLDGEDSHIGDPARDIGYIAGDTIRLGLVDVIGRLGASARLAGVFERAGATALERIAPAVSALIGGYAELRDFSDHACVRAARYAGWGLLESMLVSARSRGNVPAVDRALAGIGARLLVDPDQFRHGVGLRLDGLAS